jgi:hypothetical protein
MCQRRVLLARIGEVRQVQFCKLITTIEDSLEPLYRLTHTRSFRHADADE